MEYFQKVRRGCWELIEKRYPEEKDKYLISGNLLVKSLKNDCTVLDVGCGHKSVVSRLNSGVRVVGLDMVLEDIKKNKSIDFKVVSNINLIPLKKESVDIVVCNMVIEHLDNPNKAFSELSIVLKKGGYLIFMTPCIYNIVTFSSRIIPNRFHKKLANMLMGTDESDVFPTFYRANSISKLRDLLAKNGFVERDIIMYQPPPYAFVFSKVVCRMVIYYYKLINKYDFLKPLRGVIIARFQKE